MKVRLAVILTSLGAVGTAPAFAGVETGFIKDLSVRDPDGLIQVSLVLPYSWPGNHPPCAVRPYWVVADETSEAGKRLFATLLAAQVAGHKVTIRGKNTCSRLPDGEDIEDVNVIGVE